MNYKLLAWVAGGLLGIAVLAGIAVALLAPSPSVPQPTNPVTLPSSGSVPYASSTAPSAATMTLTTPAGEMTVKDFINNGTTVEDDVNPGDYLLAGSLAYCSGEPGCDAAQTEGFMVYYHGVPQLFNITLTEEPIGEARLRAESFMVNALGIPGQELCNLNYRVGVTRYVNPEFSGKNLGFSFCPGATRLPQ